MVKVSRLQGKEFFVNPDMIEFIEETPDVVVSMISGKKIIVEGSADELIERIVEYRLRTRGTLPNVVRRGMLNHSAEPEVSMDPERGSMS